MAVWTTRETGLDWQLAQNGFCSAFHGRSVLEAAVEWLLKHGYRVVRFDAARWVHPERLHDDLARALDFPASYGRNLDAVNDCLGDVAELAYGWRADDRGLVLVVDEYDTFHGADATTAEAVLEIAEEAGRRASLFGNRLLMLVRCADPGFAFPPVGARPVMWNPAEWLDSRRATTD